MSVGKILFSFSGRIPRRTYWLAILATWTALFIVIVAAGLIGRISDAAHDPPGSSSMMFLGAPLLAFALWITLAISVKRWHDRNKSVFFFFFFFGVLFSLVPVIGPVWTLIELGFLEGTQGLNDFEEGQFSKNVLLADDDPSLSAPPIVGRRCVQCEQQIASFVDAELCKACKEPLHHNCCRHHLADFHGGSVPAAYPG